LHHGNALLRVVYREQALVDRLEFGPALELGLALGVARLDPRHRLLARHVLEPEVRIFIRQYRSAHHQGRHEQEEVAGLHGFIFAWWGVLSSSNSRCSTRTASSMYFSSTTTEVLISEVEIIWMLMRSAASAPNIFAAIPAWVRMPIPTSETFAMRSSPTMPRA